MTFEQWWKENRSHFAGDSQFAAAEAAWNDAYAAGKQAGAEEEREACAKVCETKSDSHRKHSESPLLTDAGKDLHFTMHVASSNCAAAIRARGETPAPLTEYDDGL